MTVARPFKRRGIPPGPGRLIEPRLSTLALSAAAGGPGPGRRRIEEREGITATSSDTGGPARRLRAASARYHGPGPGCRAGPSHCHSSGPPGRNPMMISLGDRDSESTAVCGPWAVTRTRVDSVYSASMPVGRSTSASVLGAERAPPAVARSRHGHVTVTSRDRDCHGYSASDRHSDS